jgi:transmembrane sensor
MNKKYLTYSLEELLDDADFVAYLLHGTHKIEWELLFQSSPELQRKAINAKKIIEALRDSHEELSEKEVLTLWQNIDRYDNLMLNKQKKRVLYAIMRYAAVILLLVSVGTVAWFYVGKDKTDKSYQFSETYTPPAGGDARLILRSGEEIALQKENSIVEVGQSGEIKVNKEQIIDSRQALTGKSAAMNEVVVPYGKKSQLLLADGTKVWLNAGSRMAFPSEFNGTQRTVFLEGEAYFEVAHNAAQSFVVNAKEVAVKVLGTRFNISAYTADETVETVLLEGKVSLMDNSSKALSKKEVMLSPNQKAIFGKESRQFEVGIVSDAELYTAWVSGWFRFSQESLFSVLRKLERYYNVQFVCDRDFQSGDLISGKLDLKDSLEQVMLALADVAGIEYRINENNITISKTIGEIPLKK